MGEPESVGGRGRRTGEDVGVTQDDARSSEPAGRPDVRFSLANERTFLAYMRTALGLVAGAVAIAALGNRVDTAAVRYLVAALLVGLGLLTTAWGFLRWREVETSLLADRPVPRTRFPQLLAAGLVLVCVAAAVVIALS